MNQSLRAGIAALQGRRVGEVLLIGLAAAAFLYAARLALLYSDQPPLEWHSFRQAQTALNAYWLARDGFRLAYETPVAGYPWSIPFEFPLYEWLVALISNATGASLDSTGRITSFAFLALCLWPVHAVIRRLDLPSATFWCFVAITFSSPLYVFWGRSFMIETTALFFTVSAIRYFVDIMVGKPEPKRLLLFFLFASLAVLQKSTTALPALMTLSVAFCIQRCLQLRSVPTFMLDAKAWKTGACVVAAVLVGYAWVRFSDAQKALNPLGQHMTSYMLSPFNLGTAAQRVSPELWQGVLWDRMFVKNASGILGAALLLAPFVFATSVKVRSITVVATALSLLPLLVFTNLHLVHDYYQTANMLYLFFAISVAATSAGGPEVGLRPALVATALIVASNLIHLRSEDQLKIGKRFDKTSRDVAIGAVLKRELAEEGQFVAFGNDWSSTFGYLSERKSFTVPVWLPALHEVAARPQDFVEKDRLGAVVACATGVPSLPDLVAWSAKDGRNWKIGRTHECLIATPQAAPPSRPTRTIECVGNINGTKARDGSGYTALSLDGWVLDASGHGELPAPLFFELSSGGGEPQYFEALRVPRPDVTATKRTAETVDAGLSRVVTTALPAGEYTIRIVSRGSDGDSACRFSKTLKLPN